MWSRPCGFFVCAWLLPAFFLLPSPTAGQTGAVGGSILESGSGRPLQDVRISLETIGPVGSRLEGRTDANGSFLIANIPAGRYVFTAELYGFTAASDTVVISTTVQPSLQSVQFFIDDTMDVTQDFVLLNDSTYSYSKPLPSGQHTLTVYAQDQYGWIDTATSTFSVALDATAPAVIITDPSADTLVANSPFTVTYTVDGTTMTKAVDLVQGPNQVVVDSTDPAGNTGSDTVTITLDSIAPKVVITSPSTDTLVGSASLTVVYTVDTVQNTRVVTLSVGANQVVIDSVDAAGNLADTV